MIASLQSHNFKFSLGKLHCLCIDGEKMKRLLLMDTHKPERSELGGALTIEWCTKFFWLDEEVWVRIEPFSFSLAS